MSAFSFGGFGVPLLIIGGLIALVLVAYLARGLVRHAWAQHKQQQLRQRQRRQFWGYE